MADHPTTDPNSAEGDADARSALRERVYTKLHARPDGLHENGVRCAPCEARTEAILEQHQKEFEELRQRAKDAEHREYIALARLSREDVTIPIDLEDVIATALGDLDWERSDGVPPWIMTRLIDALRPEIATLTERAERAEQELAENTGVLQALRRQRDEAEAERDQYRARWTNQAFAADQVIERAKAERDQLAYERRLLYVARITLDLVAAGGPERWDEARKAAEDVAQRIVDEIGHSVTDEPALGPGFRAEITRLKAALHAATKAIHDAEFQLSCEDAGAAWEKLGDWHRAHGYEGDGEEDCAHCDSILTGQAALDRSETAEAAVQRARNIAAQWAALAPADDWADSVPDTIRADCGRELLAALNQMRPDQTEPTQNGDQQCPGTSS